MLYISLTKLPLSARNTNKKNSENLIQKSKFQFFGKLTILADHFITIFMTDLKAITSHFAISGEVAEIKPLGSGLINDTFLVTTRYPRYPGLRITTHQSGYFHGCSFITGKYPLHYLPYPLPFATTECKRYRQEDIDFSTCYR